MLEIGWSTGETLPVDLSDLAQPPFDALRNPSFFACMTRDEWGHGLACLRWESRRRQRAA